jgi:hypothetical protein
MFLGSSLSFYQDLDAKDVDTPRGESAKAEVIRLRKLLKERYDLEQAAAAPGKFSRVLLLLLSTLFFSSFWCTRAPQTHHCLFLSCVCVPF